MSNALYPKFKELCLGAGAGLAGATVKALLIDTASYNYSAAHQFLSDVAVGARVGAAVTLAGKSVANGVFDANDATFSGLVSAPTIEAILLFLDTGVEATSALVAFIDTASGLPIAAGMTGGTVTWDNGANKIFAL